MALRAHVLREVVTTNKIASVQLENQEVSFGNFRSYQSNHSETRPHLCGQSHPSGAAT